MTKSEKRAFKLYAKRGSGTQHLFLKLFDLMDAMAVVDDKVIMSKLKLDSAGQFSNLKRHLHAQLLSSLRMLYVEKRPNIKIREAIDYAYVLYGKGLYLQALRVLEGAKRLCVSYGTDLSLMMILEIEKMIHSRHITRLKSDNLDQLLDSTDSLSHSIVQRVMLSNLKMRLHRMYIEKGHVKNAKELKDLTKYFTNEIGSVNYDELRIMEKIYYCQSQVWFNYVIDDYESCIKYAIDWVELFKNSESLMRRDYNLLLRGYHYVLTSAYNIADAKTHLLYLNELEDFRKSNYNKFNKNNKITSFLYVHTGRLNNHFLNHTYDEGIKIIPRTLARIKRYTVLDSHKTMVLDYKIAWMYIGAKMPAKSLPFLDRIISQNRKSLRKDIQSYARLMYLMALSDLDEIEQMLNLLKKYKSHFKQDDEINILQESALKYFYKLGSSPLLDRKEIHLNYIDELERLQKDRYERRAFLYLDILYWVKRKVSRA